MILGIVIGTYSSIYVVFAANHAGPVLWGRRAADETAAWSRTRVEPASATFTGNPMVQKKISYIQTLGLPIPRARKPAMSTLTRIAAAARRCRVDPPRRRLREEQDQGGHRLRRPRRQHALQCRLARMRPQITRWRPDLRRGRAPASLFGLGAPRAADERVQLLMPPATITKSIDSARRFLSIHPGNRDAPYALYLIALNYYEQIRT